MRSVPSTTFARFRTLAATWIVACVLLGTAGVQAGDPAEQESARRLSRLKRRAADWWQTRKGLSGICIQCGGKGKVIYGRRGLVNCPKCDGRRRLVDADRWRKLYYEMRSPAFRLQDGIKERLGEEFKQVRAGKPGPGETLGKDWPTTIKKYRIAEVELADDTHGVVHVEENDDRTARPQRWIWSEEKGKESDWFLWDEQADGAWVVLPRSGSTSRSGGPFAKVVDVTWDKTLPKEDLLLWRLILKVETPDPIAHATWVVSGLWLDFLLAESEGSPAWQVVSHTPNAAVLQIGGTLKNEMSPSLFALKKEDWVKDILVRPAEEGEAPARPPDPPSSGGAPTPTPTPAAEAGPTVLNPQLDRTESRALLATWREEDESQKAQVAALRERLPEVQGDKAERVKQFLAEADAWLDEARKRMDQVEQYLGDKDATIALGDRSKVNVLHFKVHRNVLMVEELLPVVR